MDEDVVTTIKPEEFQISMPLKEFCDKFKFQVIRGEADTNDRLKLWYRSAVKTDQSVYYPLTLKPFFNAIFIGEVLFTNHICKESGQGCAMGRKLLF